MVAGTSESSRLGPQAGGKEDTQEMGLVFGNHKATPVTHFLQYHTSQSFPRNSINWDKVFKHTESVGAILIQSATLFTK